MQSKTIKVSAIIKSLTFAFLLAAIALLPLQAPIGSYLWEAVFFRHLEKPSFFLMLAMYSFVWTLFSFKYGTQAFSFYAYINNLLRILLIYLILAITAFVVLNLSEHVNGYGRIAATRTVTYILSGTEYLAAYIDVITVCIFLIYLVRSVIRGLSLPPCKVRNSSAMLFSITGAVVFTGVMVADLYCSSYSCRQAYLEKTLGQAPFTSIQNYINDSNRLYKDIGPIESFALKRGSYIENESFMDYMVRVSVEVRGRNGGGYLNVQMTGNDSQNIDNIDSTWTNLTDELN